MQKVALSSYDKKIIRKVIERALDDGSPVESDKRKSYVMQTAAFYEDIFEALLNHVLLSQYKALGVWNNTRERDLVIKGSIEAIKVIRDWFDKIDVEYSEIIDKNKDGNPPSEENGERVITSYLP